MRVSFENSTTFAMYFSFCIFLVNVVGVLVFISSTDAVQESKSQPNAPLVQGQSDYNRWETTSHNSMNRNAEINELQNEIRDLRYVLIYLFDKPT